MKKLILLLTTLITLLSSVFSQNSQTVTPFKDGLNFYNRFLTDEELDQLPFPEITVSNYDKLYHTFPNQNGLGHIYFNRDLEYQSKYLILENDSKGNQCFHFFLDPAERPYVKKLQNIIELKNTYYVSDNTFMEFNFSIPPDNTAEYDFVHINTNFKIKYKSVIKFYVVKDKLVMSFFDHDTKFPYEEAKVKCVKTCEMGVIKSGEDNHLFLSLNNYKLTAEFNGQKETYKLSKTIPKTATIHYVFGFENMNRFKDFSEIIVKDLKVSNPIN